MRAEREHAEEALVDRQILLATLVALALAATIKIVAPLETAAIGEAGKIRIPAATAVQPDTKWLVGP